MFKTTASCRFHALVGGSLGFTVLLLSAGAAHSLVPGVCRAPTDRPPCGASYPDPATEPDLDSGVSNPIHFATGEKYLRETDLPAPIHGGHPSFVRLYRSGQSATGILGTHWTHEYQTRLETVASGWRITEADGRRFSFNAQGLSHQSGGGHLQGLPTHTPHTSASPSTHGQRWTRGDHRQLDFDPQGRLQAIHAPGQPTTTLIRHQAGLLAGHIHHIRRAASTLTLHYDTTGATPRLSALDTPLGTFHYTYVRDAPAPPASKALSHPETDTGKKVLQLAEVQRPDGMRRHYHYEPTQQAGHPAAITGITLADVQGRSWRARSWSWDQAGRVVQAESGSAGQTPSALDFTYDLPGKAPNIHRTRVTGPAGQVDLSYRTQGNRALPLTAYTTACPRCPRKEHPVVRDPQGRLSTIGTLHIQRHPGGAIRRLHTEHNGWPGLTLDFDAIGRRTAWASTLTGRTEASFDAANRLQSLRHANGDTLDIARDPAGRPAKLHYASPRQDSVTVGLQWHGARLRQLSHPAEEETRRYDAQGRLSGRTVRRPHPTGTLRYQEQFSYDVAGRLLRHDLPEGGALLYQWARDTRLTALTWESAEGKRHPVIQTEAGLPGYRYGNGLHLQSWVTPGRAANLLLSYEQQPFWAEQRPIDAQGRISGLHQVLFSPDVSLPLRSSPRNTQSASYALDTALTRHFAYDADDRLIGMRQASDGATARTTWLAWNKDGGLAARHSSPSAAAHETSPTHLTLANHVSPRTTPQASRHPITRDASGLPQSAEGHTLRYQAQRLLAEIRTGQGKTIHYTHNAQGHTIRRRNGAHETERYYLDNRLVAIWQRPNASTIGPPDAAPPPTFGVTHRYLYAHEVPVGLLHTDNQGHTRLYAIHADLTGRPVLVTDDHRMIRWSATYDTFGKAHTEGDLALPLRAPGQDEDPTTGWHNNVFRTYLPDAGHYLEPDPLGPVPGQQALGYAAQQPMRHADPLGLILLAFDGTRYGRENQGNVWKFTQAYDDGSAYYQAGPGNNLSLDWDAITAASSGQILRTQWQTLLGALQRAQGSAQAVPIDLLGFSRGAALARDFANRIARQTRNGWFSYDDPLQGSVGLCVDLRFLGLFDTVAQFGLLGAANAGYDLTLSGAWQWVAHAVALHEFRTLLPLVSATQGTSGHAVEAPFIGAHADIGGGLSLDDRGNPIPDGDLSDVALNWMRWQALAALVPMKALSAQDQHVTQALLHDDRIPAERLLENGDRTLQDATTHPLGPQGADAQIGTAQRQALEAFIRRSGAWQITSGNVVGTVDMAGYDLWLQETLGLPSLVRHQ